MKISKKLGIILATAALPLAACGGTADTLSVYAPDGAPALALSGMMSKGFDGAEFTVVAPTTIAAHVSNGDADIAVMPVNAAAALYNGGLGITMLSVNTHGNLYLVGDADDGMTLEKLKGARVGVIGQAQVPDLTLRMLLGESGIEYVVSENATEGAVALRYAADGSALMPLFKQGAIDYAFIAEPAATTACAKFDKEIVLDAQQLWRDAFGSDYPQACVVAKKGVVEKNKKFVDAFLKKLAETEGWAEAHPTEAAETVGAHTDGTGSTLTALDAGIVKRCNIKHVSAADAKSACESFFEKLTQMHDKDFEKPPLTKKPDDGFYYKA